MGTTISSRTTGPVVLTAADDPLTITSTGKVVTTNGNVGIEAPVGTVWTITNAGTVFSIGNYAIQLEDTGGVTNTGLIKGVDALGFRAGGTVVNAATGTIFGFGTAGSGIHMTGGFGTVVNYGSVLGEFIGVNLQAGGSVTNSVSASIVGYGDAGVFFNGQSGTLTNAGTIEGTGTNGASVYLEVGGNVTNNAAALMSGTSFGVFIEGGSGGTLSNAGTIVGTNKDGVVLGIGGSVINAASGYISGGSNGVYFKYRAAGTVTNNGTILGNVGVFLDDGGVVGNAASGTISGSNHGVVIFGAVGTVTNSGTVVGGTQDGVILGVGGLVTNAVGASVTGGSNGVYAQSAAAATIINAGSLTAGVAAIDMAGGGAITNSSSAFIAGNAFGIFVSGAAATVSNAGTISGGSYAIDFANSANNRLVVDPGAVFVGTVGGNSNTNMLELSGTGVGTLSGFGTEIVHFDSLLVDAFADWDFAGLTTVGNNVSFMNDGKVVLSNGETLTVNTGVAADPGDAGNFLVAGGAILALQTAVSSDQTIAFGDLGAELVIGDAKDFAATLTGFVAGDTIDVANTIVTSATISGGMLTANIQGGGTQTFAVTGDFSSDHLEVASDGNNGTDLILYRLAQASVVANPVEFGFVHVGEAVSEALTVTNTGVAGLFTENLDASFGNATGNVTASGAFVGLSAGSSNSNSLTVGLDTQSAAVIDSSVTIALTSDGSGIDNLGSTTLAAQTIDVTGTINNYVTAQFEELSGGGTFSQSGSDYTLDLGTLAAGSGSAEINLGVLNAAIGPADFLSGSFVATSPSGTDPFSNSGLNPFTGLAAGQDYTGASIVVDTSDIGTFSETIALDPTGYNPGGYLAGLGAEMLTITEETAPCYSKGTYILTPSGEVAVEALRVGETVSTLEGTEIVRWIGRRRIDLSRHPRPETAAPIRIECGAFMDNVPHRDLLVSPDHAIYVDGKLICARQLVNGTTIRQEKGLASVEYFHVELGAHSILLAERLPAESYLNTGNKSLFANQSEAMALYPELANEVDYPTREAASCAPFVWEEAVVQPVWQRLANRAALLGRPVPDLNTTTDPELRVIVNNRTLRPVSDKDGVYTFVLRAGASAVQIISRANAPTDVRPWLEDTRLLGVYVHRIVLRTMGEVLEIPVDHPGLWKGWWAVERNGTMLRRWTNGDALLPLPDFSEPTILEIHASASGVAYLIKDDRDRGIKSNDVIRREAA